MAAKVIKWSFFTFNLLVLIFGILVIVVGVSGHHEAGLAVLSNILIGVGFVAALLGFIGCFGAAKEIRPLLTGKSSCCQLPSIISNFFDKLCQTDLAKEMFHLCSTSSISI